ncbi:MAG: methyltransferase domain-containing protein [Planctomycetota bacterium]|nr:MAG: methyltransferase domain-containing protein [Planctomycetota bacterium]
MPLCKPNTAELMTERPAPASTSQPEEYVLGWELEELDRLAHQHQIWRRLSDAVFAELPVGRGWKVLDAGCGPGWVLQDLQAYVGDEGELWGVDLVPEMLQATEARGRAGNWNNLHLLQGDLAEVALPKAHFDFIWCRWVLSFLPDPGAVLQRLRACLKPGGVLAIQDYNHEGIGLFPESAAFQTMVKALRKRVKDSGGDLWIGARLGALLPQAGLQVHRYRSHVYSGSPGDPVWQWGQNFFLPWAKKMLLQGYVNPQEYQAFLEDWQQRRQQPGARFFSPIVITALGRKDA